MANETVTIVINAKGDAQQKIQGVSSSLGGLAKAVGSPVAAVGGMVNVLGKIGLAGLGISAVANAVGSLSGVIGGVIGNASNLNETLNKSAVVFGAANTIIEEMGKTSVQSLGMSRQTAVAAASDFGNLFTSLQMGQQPAAEMSTSLVKLAADLASFHNIRPEDALEKLRAGLVGEAEPLRVLGIALNEEAVAAKALQMGLAGVKTELTAADKIQARYALIMQMSANAQGDFARTSTGLANSQRIINAAFTDISATVGSLFLPALELLAAAFKDVLTGIQVWLDENKAMLQDWSAKGAAYVGIIIDAVRQLAPAFSNALMSTLGVVWSVGQLIYEALSYLNPFATHSPSLVSQVESGINLIMAKYGSLAGITGPLNTAKGAILAFAQTADAGMVAYTQHVTDAQIKTLQTFGADMPQAYAEAQAAMIGVEAEIYNLNMAIIAQSQVVLQHRAAIAALDEELYALQEQLYEAQLAMGDSGGGGFAGATIDTAAMLEPFQIAVEKAQEVLQGLQGELSAAKGELDKFTGMNIQGTKAFTDQMFALEQQTKRAELNLMNLKMGGGSKKEIAAAEKAVQALRDQASKLKLEEELRTDPLKKQIQDLAKPMQELPFGDIIKGIKESQSKIDTLTPAIALQETVLKSAQTTLKEQTKSIQEMARAMGGAASAASANTEAIKALQAAIHAKEKERREAQKDLEPEAAALQDLETQRSGLQGILNDWDQFISQTLSKASQWEGILEAARKAAEKASKAQGTIGGTGGLGVPGLDTEALTTQIKEQTDKIKEALNWDETVGKWNENIKTFGGSLDRLTDSIKGITAELGPWREIIAGAVASFASLMVILKVTGWITALAAAIGGASAAFSASGSVIGAIVAALGGPVTVIIAAVAVAVGLLAAAWIGNWFGMRDVLTEVWNGYLSPTFDALLQAFKDVWVFIDKNILPIIKTLVSGAFKTLTDGISFVATAWNDVLGPALNNVWLFISDYLLPLLQALAELGLAVITLGFRILSGVVTEIVLPVLGALWRLIDEHVLAKFRDLWSFLDVWVIPVLKALTTEIADFLGPKLLWLKERVVDKLVLAFEFLKAGIQFVIDKIKELTGAINGLQLPDWLTPGSPTPLELGLKGISAALDDLNRIRLPAFSTQLKVQTVPTPSIVAGGGGRTYQITNNFYNADPAVQSSWQIQSALAGI